MHRWRFRNSLSRPNTVTSIGAYAFAGCTSLTEIAIPATVTSIGNRAFEGCTSLTEITYNGTSAQWDNIAVGRQLLEGHKAVIVHCTDGDVTIFYRAWRHPKAWTRIDVAG